eukprot:snap_masked-scaffold268_size230776-processed-gene-1.22 protein:Tk11104 transcript:snap_masked-scaffold268_size230776-processed-gene-1.22-mRNA-1 annotation:"enhancer of mrna-decapping protein 3"
MNSDWLGQTVSLQCGALGYYQGVIHAVHLQEQTITLKNAFQNGKPCALPSITLKANAIEELNFLQVQPPEKPVTGKAAKSSSSTVVKRKSRPVAENLASAAASKIQPIGPSRSSPAIQAAVAGGSSGYQQPGFATNFQQHLPRKLLSGSHRAPSRKDHRIRDDDCFGEIDESEIGQEFDFESNLALFDKKLVFEEINDEIAANQPDLVRLVDCNRRKPETKYRNDENVLVSVPAQYRPIETGEVPPPGEYVTDTGLIVPAISLDLRNRLEDKMRECGISMERITELMARAAVELAIQLFGGAHRMNPNNSHQVPLAIIMVGPNRSGVFGLATARHLTTQGVRTAAYLPDVPHYPSDITQELALYRMSGGQVCTTTKNLPQGTVDLIINSMEDHDMWMQERQQPWVKAAQKWLESHCPLVNVLAIDPPNCSDEPLMKAKICLVPGLPLWHGDHFNNGAKIYTASMAVPQKVYQSVGIKYSPPYGAKTVIPLHRVT